MLAPPKVGPITDARTTLLAVVLTASPSAAFALPVTRMSIDL